MKIHEYQGKEILKKYGVAVPRLQAAYESLNPPGGGPA